jgi:hypothetical protein
MTELFANPGTANPVVTSGGTTTPASGTSETWTITGLSGVFPAVSSAAAPPTFCRCCDPALPSEILWITNISGTTATVTRGAEGRTAVNHGLNFTLELLITGGGLSGFAQGWPGLVSTLVAKSAAYTATAADNIIVCNAATAAFTITLPTAVGALGRTYTIKKTDSSANAVTVDPNGSQTIDGQLTVTLARQWQYVQVVSDGANWQLTDSPLTLDGTATDIQPLGTQAAGNSPLAAAANHVHAMPRLDQVAAPTAALAMNGQKITGGANGTASTDFATIGQLPAVPNLDSTAGDFLGLGTGAAGSSPNSARADHVHPAVTAGLLTVGGTGLELPSAVTNQAAVSNSVAVSTVAQLTVPANEPSAGAVYEIWAYGIYSMASTATSLAFGINWGAQSLGSQAVGTGASAANARWRIHVMIVFNSATQCFTNAKVDVATTNTGATSVPGFMFGSTSNITVTVSSAQVLALTLGLGAANASDAFTIFGGKIWKSA